MRWFRQSEGSVPPILSFCYINGDSRSRLQPVSYDQEITTLDQASLRLSEGAYTTFRTYPNHTVLHLSEHFSRLEESSRLAGYPIGLDAAQLRSNLRQALQQFSAEVARVRVTIPFSGRNHQIYLFVGALSVPTAIQRSHGVKVISKALQRSQPGAKLTGFITSTQELRKTLDGGIEEVIMVDEKGNILEGLTSNFYAVISGTVHTAGEGVLPGITRQMVLDVASLAGIPISLTAPSLAEIDHFDEAFITSTSRSVLPVTQIDSLLVSGGQPGPITQRLMTLYEQQVLAEAQPI